MGLFSRKKKKNVALTNAEKKKLEKDELLMSGLAAINAQHGSYESPLASMPGVKRISPLTYACHIGEVHMVKKAINNGSDINETDDEGTTPIHAAAEHGYLEIVTLLLDLGAEKNSPNKDGVLPIELADKKGHLSIVALLGGKEQTE